MSPERLDDEALTPAERERAKDELEAIGKLLEEQVTLLKVLVEFQERKAAQ